MKALRIMLVIVLVIAALNSKSIKADDEDPSEHQIKITKDIRRMTRQTAKICARVLKRAQKEYKELQKREKAIQEDIKLLAEVIYYENWTTDPEKESAWLTGVVVLNRVKSKDWPDTVHDVLYQRGQYSTTKKFFTKELPDEVYAMAEDLIRNGTGDVPENVVFQSTFKQGKGIYKVIKGEYFCYG